MHTTPIHPLFSQISMLADALTHDKYLSKDPDAKAFVKTFKILNDSYDADHRKFQSSLLQLYQTINLIEIPRNFNTAIHHAYQFAFKQLEQRIQDFITLDKISDLVTANEKVLESLSTSNRHTDIIKALKKSNESLRAIEKKIAPIRYRFFSEQIEKYGDLIAIYLNNIEINKTIDEQIKTLEKNRYKSEFIRISETEWRWDKECAESHGCYDEPSWYREVKHERPEIIQQINKLKAQKIASLIPQGLPKWAVFYVNNAANSFASDIIVELEHIYQHERLQQVVVKQSAVANNNNNNDPVLNNNAEEEIALPQPSAPPIALMVLAPPLPVEEVVLPQPSAPPIALMASAPPLPVEIKAPEVEKELKDNHALYADLKNWVKNNNGLDDSDDSKALLEELLQNVFLDAESTDLECAGTETLMLKPMIASGNDAYVADESFWVLILAKDPRHPTTRAPITSADIEPAIAVHQKITAYLELKIKEQIALSQSVVQQTAPVQEEANNNNNQQEDVFVQEDDFVPEALNNKRWSSIKNSAYNADSYQSMLDALVKNYAHLAFSEDKEIIEEVAVIQVENNSNNNQQENDFSIVDSDQKLYMDRLNVQDQLLKNYVQSVLNSEEDVGAIQVENNSNNNQQENNFPIIDLDQKLYMDRLNVQDQLLKNYVQPVLNSEEDVGAIQVENNSNNNNQLVQEQQYVQEQPSKEDLLKQLEGIKAPTTVPQTDFFNHSNSNSAAQDNENNGVQEVKKKEPKRAVLG